MNLPIYEIFIEDTEHIAVALVDEPAIESDFIFFQGEEPIKLIFNDEKMIVKGPALIPNKLIYRRSNNGERYVFYSEDTIMKFVELFMKKKENKFNLSHTDNYIEANIIESYFANEPNEFGVPKNSWIVSAKINDPVIWNKIKNGELNGFSVEGLFGSQLVEFAECFNEQKNKNGMKELKEKLLSAINSILFEDEKPEEVVEQVEEQVEQVEEKNEEDFEMVDSQEVAAKVEEKVMEATAAVDAASDDALTIDSVKSLLEQLKVAIVEDLRGEMGGMVEEAVQGMKKELTEVKDKVEEFSKQPITESIIEEIANPKIDTNVKAAKFFSK